MSNPVKDSVEILHTLRLPPEQLAELIKRVHAREEADPQRKRRRTPRHKIDAGVQVLVQFIAPKLPIQPYEVYVTDLSRAGVCVFHGFFLYPGTKCRMWMKAVNGKATTLTGEVKRCGLVEGTVHEVGIAFDAEIDVSNFLSNATEPPPAAAEATPSATGPSDAAHGEPAPSDPYLALADAAMTVAELAKQRAKPADIQLAIDALAKTAKQVEKST
jgi:hypothetical protein